MKEKVKNRIRLPDDSVISFEDATYAEIDTKTRQKFGLRVDKEHPAGRYEVEVLQDGDWVIYQSFNLQGN